MGGGPASSALVERAKALSLYSDTMLKTSGMPYNETTYNDTIAMLGSTPTADIRDARKVLKQDNERIATIQARDLPLQSNSEYEQGLARTTAALREHLAIHEQAEEEGEQAINELLRRGGDDDDEMDVDTDTPAFITQELRRGLFE